LQDVLAKALHRVCKIPIKETENDFEDEKFKDTILKPDKIINDQKSKSKSIF